MNDIVPSGSTTVLQYFGFGVYRDLLVKYGVENILKANPLDVQSMHAFFCFKFRVISNSKFKWLPPFGVRHLAAKHKTVHLVLVEEMNE